MNDSLQIGTLRAPASAGHNAARLPLERALAAADLRPSGLPAGAVLIVQRLATTRPTAGRAWEQRARAQMEELYRHAVRPAHGHDARNAQAVLFADRAELLACLLDDLLAHRAATQWWWRCYMRDRPAQIGQLLSLLAEEVTALPTTFAHLAIRGRAVAVAQALPPPAARILAERLAIAYDAGPLPLQVEQNHQSASQPATPNATATPPASPPWPSQPSSLTREQHLLLGLALTISARPTAPRSPTFRRALAQWWHATQSAPLVIPPSIASHIPTRSAEPPTAEQPPQTAPTSPTHVPQTSAASPTTSRSIAGAPKPEQIATPNSAPPAETTLSGTPQQAAQQPPITTQPSHMPAPPEEHTTQSSVNEATATSPQPMPQRITDANATPYSAANASTSTPHIADNTPPTDAHEALNAAPWLSATGAHSTELGGVLFLINLLAYLKLPELFAPVWPLERTLSAWKLLELVARGLLTDAATYTNDPLWHVLAALDGRAADAAFAQTHGPRIHRTRAGRRRLQRIRPSRTYRIPSAWLQALPADPNERLYWTASHRHLRIWSSRGFVLFDGAVPRLNAKSVHTILAQLSVAVHQVEEASAHPPSLRIPKPTETPAWIQRWLTLSLPYIRLRLALALGLRPHDDLDTPLLARRGTLIVSATHIDLVLSLESTSIEVRLAGLDRNPGWLTEYGRVILFYFVTPEQEAQQ